MLHDIVPTNTPTTVKSDCRVKHNSTETQQTRNKQFRQCSGYSYRTVIVGIR